MVAVSSRLAVTSITRSIQSTREAMTSPPNNYSYFANKFTLFIHHCLPSSFQSHLTHRRDIHSAVSQSLDTYQLCIDLAKLLQNDSTSSNWCNRQPSFQSLFLSLSHFIPAQLFVVLQCCGLKLVPIWLSA